MADKKPKAPKLFAPYGEHPLDRLLNAQMYIESSGGVDTDHDIIEKGLHAGDRAHGVLGIMPNTRENIKGMLRKEKLQDIPDTLYRQAVGEGDPEGEARLLDFLAKDKETQNKEVSGLSSPELQLALGRVLATSLSKKLQDNPEAITHAWQYGTTKSPTPDALANSERVKKYLKVKDLPLVRLAPKDEPPEIEDPVEGQKLFPKLLKFLKSY